MKIGITGGSGFIGEATQRAAKAAGHEVFSFDRVAGHSILGDLDPLDDCEAIIHLAGVLGTAELFETPYDAIDMNVRGALNIIERCHLIGARYVGITMPPVFPSVYTATKICADRLASAWYHSYGLHVSRVCAYNAFGEGQKHGPGHPQKIIPTFATEAWAGRPIPIWGDGEQTVDLVDVDDVGRMLVDAVRFGEDQIFDAGTARSLSVNEVADFVISVTGSTAGKKYMRMRPGEVATNIVATGQGWDLLDWRPRFDWERLAEVIEWYHPDVVRD